MTTTQDLNVEMKNEVWRGLGREGRKEKNKKIRMRRRSAERRDKVREEQGKY